MTESIDLTATTWRIIAVTALPPGWRNVYQRPGEEPISEICPAILLLEKYDDYIGQMIKTDPKRQRTTRAVFASINEFGELEPIADSSEYVTTEFTAV